MIGFTVTKVGLKFWALFVTLDFFLKINFRTVLIMLRKSLCGTANQVIENCMFKLNQL